MRRFAEKYFGRKGSEGAFSIKIMGNAPLQQNGYDCGVFICQNAEKIARAAPITTKQSEMAKAREMMLQEIFLGRLLTEKDSCLIDFVEKSTPAMRPTMKENKRKDIKKNEMKDCEIQMGKEKEEHGKK